ncbi:MAG: ThiF family adenylyltransferase [Bacilli bacterium]|jgi:tRNA A37 threonylcarbamoyladenosine dehydratase
MEKRLERLKSLLGEEKIMNLNAKTVLVCGLGGVGGTCLESLARSGIGHFLIVDYDRVEATNLNRQILFLEHDLGELKVEVARKRLLSISPSIKVMIYSQTVDEKLLDNLSKVDIDFVIDAIDSPLAKTNLIHFCIARKVPFISSLGMANRLNPSLVKISNLEATDTDPLAKKMRNLLRKKNIRLSDVPVVYSLEKPLIKGPRLASGMNVPSAAGLMMSYFCLESLLKQ